MYSVHSSNPTMSCTKRIHMIQYAICMKSGVGMHFGYSLQFPAFQKEVFDWSWLVEIAISCVINTDFDNTASHFWRSLRVLSMNSGLMNGAFFLSHQACCPIALLLVFGNYSMIQTLQHDWQNRKSGWLKGFELICWQLRRRIRLCIIMLSLQHADARF